MSEHKSEGLKATALHGGRKHKTTTPKKKAPRKPTAKKKPAAPKDKPELTPEQLKAREKWRLEREAWEEACNDNQQRVQNLKAAKRAERANTMDALVKQRQQEEEEEEEEEKVAAKNAQIRPEARQKTAKKRAESTGSSKGQEECSKGSQIKEGQFEPAKRRQGCQKETKQTAKAAAGTTIELIPAARNVADCKRITQALQKKYASVSKQIENRVKACH